MRLLSLIQSLDSLAYCNGSVMVIVNCVCISFSVLFNLSFFLPMTSSLLFPSLFFSPSVDTRVHFSPLLCMSLSISLGKSSLSLSLWLLYQLSAWFWLACLLSSSPFPSFHLSPSPSLSLISMSVFLQREQMHHQESQHIQSWQLK